METLHFTTPEPDMMHIWQLWVLRVSGSKPALHVFYSWIVRIKADQNGWQPLVTAYSKSYTDKGGKSFRIELLRADYYGNASSIGEMLNGLLQGKLLNEAVPPSATTFPPTALLNLKLGPDAVQVAKTYRMRPRVFLQPEHVLIPWMHKALPSPADHGCFSHQIVYLEKEKLVRFDLYGLNPVEEKKCIEEIAQTLKRDTGFNIMEENAPRIGNIEWLTLPFSDIDFEPYVSFWVDKSGENQGRSVKVAIKPLPAGKQPRPLLVRCRLINGEEVTLDQIRKVEWNDQPLTLMFSSAEPVADIQITVWERHKNGEAAILYEQHQTLFKAIQLNMLLIGARFNTGRLNLLGKVRKNELDKARALTRFDRSTTSDVSTIGGDHSEDAWVAAGRTITTFMNKRFPQASEGQFFLNGWDNYQEASGQLTFVQWMLKIISDSSEKVLVFIDPFFDKDGIELFGHSRTTDIKYRILTCTQHRETDTSADEAITGSKAKEPKAAASIRAGCNQMTALLDGIDLSIQDLRSKEGGKGQLFHDRYLLLTNGEGIVEKGFHLSNSIQGATRKAPLLVTPIPGDILPDVLAYVNDLLAPDATNPNSRKTYLVQLYPESESPVSQVAPERAEAAADPPPPAAHKLSQIPHSQQLFSLLLSEPALKELPDEALASILLDKKILETDSGSFLMYHLLPEQLVAFAERLSRLNESELTTMWLSLGELLARSHTSTQDFTTGETARPPYDAGEELQRALGKYTVIGSTLQTILRSFNKPPEVLSYRDRLHTIFNSDSFEKGLNRALQQFVHFHGDFVNVPYGTRYAAKVLVNKFPHDAVKLLNEFFEEVNREQWNEASSNARAKMLLLTVLACNFFSYRNTGDLTLQAMLLTQGSYEIRAVSTGAVLSAVLFRDHDKPDTLQILQLLKDKVPDLEYRLSLAQTISSLNKRINQRELHLQEVLFARLTNEWMLSGEEATRITTVLSGPLLGNHSFLVTEKFLTPLITSGKLPPGFDLQLWQELLLNKVKFSEKYENGSSDTIKDRFTVNTDIELTKTMLHLMEGATSQQQEAILQEWICAIQPIWPVVMQPFAKNAQYSYYNESASRVYWIHFLIKKLLDSGKLSEVSTNLATSFLENHTVALQAVNRFVEQRTIQGVEQLNATMVQGSPQ